VRRPVNLLWSRETSAVVPHSNLARLPTLAAQRRKLHVDPARELDLDLAKRARLMSYLAAPVLVTMRKLYRSL
jgi:hypothetical protein